MRKLTVTEELVYEFNVPDEVDTPEKADTWFCELEKPHEEAVSFAVVERDCELEANEDEGQCVHCGCIQKLAEIESGLPCPGCQAKEDPRDA